MRSGPVNAMRNLLRAFDPRRRAQSRRGGEELPGVLFVCSGNICRSPTAEAVFRIMAAHAGIADRLRVDSAGTQTTTLGQPPDSRAVRAAKARGFDMPRRCARQVTPEDFLRFHWIFAMDRANLRALNELRPPDVSGSLGLYLDLVPDVDGSRRAGSLLRRNSGLRTPARPRGACERSAGDQAWRRLSATDRARARWAMTAAATGALIDPMRKDQENTR